MKRSRYVKLKQDIIFITLIVSVLPLIFLGGMIYYQFAEVLEERIESHALNLAISHRNAVEVFLRERTAILSTIVDTHTFAYLNNTRNLSNIFKVINRRADGLGLVDIGVIDSGGNQTVYIGPYELSGYNYFQQPWFGEVMAKGRYISDVYMGYRQLPHFIIAVRGYDEGHSWILRATIDSDVFNRLVRTGQFGKRGDAFIINKDGYFQTYKFTAGVSLAPGNRLVLSGGAESTELLVDADWRPLAFSASTDVEPAEVVFAGYGIVAPGSGSIPDYDAYGDVDVSGRWVMLFRYLPEGIPAEQRQHLAGHLELRAKAMLARERGAKGVIVVSGPNAGVKEQLVGLRLDTVLAGTSLAHQRHFERGAEDFRRQLMETLNRDITLNSRPGQSDYRAGPELWRRTGEYRYEGEPLRQSWARCASSASP